MDTITTRTESTISTTQPPAAEGGAARRPAGANLAEIARALRAKPFRPHRLFRNGHAQTVVYYAWPHRRRLGDEHRRDEGRLFEVEPGTRLLAHCRWQERRRERPTLVLVHGLEGSSDSIYMVGIARKAFRAGFNVVRLNSRTCGGTEHLTKTLYHSGMSGDLRHIVGELAESDGLRSIYLAGFSMGGNLVLKLAGEYGDDPPRELSGVCAVSPAMDLGACAEAIERRANWLYERSFVRDLRRRVGRKAKLFPGVYDTRNLRRVRTVRDFDELFTAVHGGFKDAEDYYRQCSALHLVPRIRVPTLIVHAQDDPFIPFEPAFRNPSLVENPHVILLATRHGGHVAFIGEAAGGEDRFWLENRVVEFGALLAGEPAPAPARARRSLGHQDDRV